ncbi:MAG: hypothetical protein ACXVHM_02070, partial [Methanobacterium sp.]
MGRNFGLNFKSLKRAFIVLLLFLILFSFFNAVSAQENKKILFDESNPTVGKLNTIHSIGTYGSSGFAN